MSEKTGSALPLGALLALAMTGFTAIMTETLPAGLLTPIALALQISPSLAGQLVTSYALGSLLAAIPLTSATRHWRRKTALLAAVLGFLLFNTLTALALSPLTILLARFLAGAAAGLAWGIIAGYARRLVAPAQQGKAMTIAMVGVPLALALGVPLGTWIGNLLGWRMAFGVMSAATLLLSLWIMRRMPDLPGLPRQQRRNLRQVLLWPGVLPVLAVVFGWVLAHNLLYTYIIPLLTPAGLSARVDSVLLIFGLSSIAGIWLTGMAVDRWLRVSVLLSLTVFAALTLLWSMAGSSAVAVWICMVLWGITFGGAGTLLQTAMADTAGTDGDVAQSLIVVTWNLAIAGGGALGGVMLDSVPLRLFLLAALLLIALSALVVWRASAAGFRPGHRLGASAPSSGARQSSCAPKNGCRQP
ncbi:MFS transporter [Affinibrenneria salicis]|uniref:MFS transporter n=1 Tax=Affinibrenneria salicis TaxID=2590031 RepID=A0A5J5G1X6_9GAMM|nr:MFS transporter [Affinibrenneria salicis]KAA9000492.1 MFS transporter [Affinibrenneria salicis]